MKVKIKRIHPDSVLPSYAKEGDAGMDLTCVEIERTENYISYKTGLAFEIPEGYFGMLVPRSSNSKKDLLLCNSVGVLDSGYRGPVEFRYKHMKPPFRGGYDNIYTIGDRIGQIIILPYPHIEFEEVNKLSETERGSGGFGSSGN